MVFEAFIIDGARAASGRRKGALSSIHPVDLGAKVVDALLEKIGVDGAEIDDVICGCVSQNGAQAANIGRGIVLASKNIPMSVPGVTVDRQCGSSQQAIHFAAQAVMSGTMDVVIAVGVESMSQVPLLSSTDIGVEAGNGHPFEAEGIKLNYPDMTGNQFVAAELLAKKYNITRDELDEFAFSSHQKAAAATNTGRFSNEIVPIEVKDKEGNLVMHSKDEGIRPNTTLEKLAKLKPLQEGGVVSAGAASQISDGAAAVIICNERGLKRLELNARARIHAFSVVGDDPVLWLGAPIPATRAVLQKANLSIGDIDLYEVNEAFASVPMAWARDLNADMNKLNVNGGACALGHPLGATGVKLMVTLLNELERRGGKFGLQAICEGGATANATIIECLHNNNKSRL